MRHQRKSPGGNRGDIFKAQGTVQANNNTSVENVKPLLQKWLLMMRAVADQRLTGADLRVLPAVLDRMNKSMEAWPGYGRIASDTGISRRTATRSIERLHTLGYLVKEPRGVRVSNLYRIGKLPTRASIDTQVDSDTQTDSGIDTQADTPIDRDDTPLSAHVTPEPDSLKPSNNPDSLNSHKPSARFDDFWKAWPKKEAKQEALESWKTGKFDSISDKIIEDVKASASVKDKWRGGDLKFCPHPAKYLNGRLWEDEWRARSNPGRLPRDDDAEAERINSEAAKRAETWT